MDDDSESLPEERSYHRQPKKNKQKKNSKNSNGYYEWFTREGRQKFFRMYGRHYNENVDDDKRRITELWQAAKDPYVQEYKVRKGKLKGVFGNLKPDEIEIEGSSQLIVRGSDGCRPPNFPFPDRTCESYECLDRHPRTITGEQDMKDRLRFFDAEKIDFSSFVLQIIAVFPYTVALSTERKPLVYPAEIAVTHYTLERGVSSCFSKLINFHPKMFYGSGVPTWDQANIEKQAKSLDVSLKEPQGVSPSEMWRLLQKQRSHRSITICDENEIWLVDSALYFLASTAGTEQLAVHKELMNGIVTAQDLIAALASHHTRVTNDSVEELLTREGIKQEFERLRETTGCCSYHQKRPPTHRSRQLCALAKTDLLIDAIDTLCYSGNLVNFRELYLQHEDRHTVSVVLTGAENETDQGGDEGEEDLAGQNMENVSPRPPSNGFKLCYEVVEDSERIFPRSGKVMVDLADTASRMLRKRPDLEAAYI